MTGVLDSQKHSDTDLAAIRERHRPHCYGCGQPWGEAGCDTAQVLAVLDGLRARIADFVLPSHDEGVHAFRDEVLGLFDAALADTGSAGDD